MIDTFRKEYRPLTDLEKSYIHQLKSIAEELEKCFNMISPPEDRSEKSRCMNIARTNLEQTVMWAVKGTSS